MPAAARIFKLLVGKLWHLLVLAWATLVMPFRGPQWRHRQLFRAGVVKPAAARAFLTQDAEHQPQLLARRARATRHLLQSCINLQQVIASIVNAREGTTRSAAGMERLAISAELATSMLPPCCPPVDRRGAAPARHLAEPRAAVRASFSALLQVAQRMRQAASSHRQLATDLAAAETRARDALETALAKATLDITRYLEERDQN